MRIGQTIYYRCREGYLTPSEDYWVHIVCSQGGWKPEPQCLSKYIYKICLILFWLLKVCAGEIALYNLTS